MTYHRIATAFVVALIAAVSTGCGGPGDDVAEVGDDVVPAEQQVGQPSGADPVGEIEGASEALDSVGLETKAGAIERAMGADEVQKIEVRGDTMHIYLKGGTFDPTMACIVTDGILSEGEQAVMHLDGDETACDEL